MLEVSGVNAVDTNTVKLVSTSLEEFLVSLVLECREMDDLETSSSLSSPLPEQTTLTMETLQRRFLVYTLHAVMILPA